MFSGGTTYESWHKLHLIQRIISKGYNSSSLFKSSVERRLFAKGDFPKEMTFSNSVFSQILHFNWKPVRFCCSFNASSVHSINLLNPETRLTRGINPIIVLIFVKSGHLLFTSALE